MKKSILLIFLMLIVAIPAYSVQLQGEIVDQARQTAFKNIKPHIDTKPYENYYKNQPEGYKTEYSNGRRSIHTGNKVYTYEDGELIAIGVSDKNVLQFPRKTSFYEPKTGKLLCVGYATSSKDSYVFRPDGSLSGIWDNGIFYQNGKPILSITTSFF